MSGFKSRLVMFLAALFFLLACGVIAVPRAEARDQPAPDQFLVVTAPAADHAVDRHGRDRDASQTAVGVYLVRMQAAGRPRARPITLVR